MMRFTPLNFLYHYFLHEGAACKKPQMIVIIDLRKKVREKHVHCSFCLLQFTNETTPECVLNIKHLNPSNYLHTQMSRALTHTSF